MKAAVLKQRTACSSTAKRGSFLRGEVIMSFCGRTATTPRYAEGPCQSSSWGGARQPVCYSTMMASDAFGRPRDAIRETSMQISETGINRGKRDQELQRHHRTTWHLQTSVMRSAADHVDCLMTRQRACGGHDKIKEEIWCVHQGWPVADPQWVARQKSLHG